jgi:uncharacterized protein
MAEADPRITREQVLEASKGCLQMQVYMVHSRPTAGLGPVMQHLAEHLQHQHRMEERGVLMAAGPHWSDDESVWEGEGTFVIRAQSMAHATELAAEDPMHKAGARSFRVRPWLINEGSLSLSLSLASGRFVLT